MTFCCNSLFQPQTRTDGENTLALGLWQWTSCRSDTQCPGDLRLNYQEVHQKMKCLLLKYASSRRREFPPVWEVPRNGGRKRQTRARGSQLRVCSQWCCSIRTCRHSLSLDWWFKARKNVSLISLSIACGYCEHEIKCALGGFLGNAQKIMFTFSISHQNIVSNHVTSNVLNVFPSSQKH